MDAPTDFLPDYTEKLDLIFGMEGDPMSLLTDKAQRLLPELEIIVWEGDAATFQFLFVSDSSELILGYPAYRWTQEPTFWADTVLHPDDRDDAIAYCALCTGKNRDHDFEYRAIAADGRVVWLHDIVRVVRGETGLATRLRGIMVNITPRREAEHHSTPLDTGAYIRTGVLEKLLGGKSIRSLVMGSKPVQP